MSPVTAVEPRAFLVTSVGHAPGTSKPAFGTKGYSYAVVASRFEPLLARLGTVVRLDRPESRLEYAVAASRKAGTRPIALAFQPLQDHYPARTAPNIVYPFWEYPDLPSEPMDYNPRFDWPRMARMADLILTQCTFTAESFARAGVKTPVHVVPVPIPEAWFQVPPWSGPAATEVPAPAVPLPRTMAKPPAGASSAFLVRRAYRRVRTYYVDQIRETVPRFVDQALTGLFRLGRRLRTYLSGPPPLPAASSGVPLTGIVYTAILQPGPRKALRDLMTAFVLALRDCADATLVLRIVTRTQELYHFWAEINPVYAALAAIPHACRIVVVTDPMTDAQMRDLAAATTYYVNATRAEGACLPPQEMMAAGRPALSPIHSAMSDYFDASVGFVIDSHPEPCGFPDDEHGRFRTMQHRLVWQSFHDQFRASYALSKNPSAYQELAARARQRMRAYAGSERVLALLEKALSSIDLTTADGAQTPAALEPLSTPNTHGGNPDCVYVEATALYDRTMTGIGRFATLLIQHLALRTEVRITSPFYVRKERSWEIVLRRSNLPRPGLNVDQWRDAVLRLSREPVNQALRQKSPGILTFMKPEACSFGRELSIVHDLTPLFVPAVAGKPLRAAFLKFCQQDLTRTDKILCDSRATRDDVAWLTGIEAEQIAFAYPGPSLCNHGHASPRPVQRSATALLVVGAHHPRKNGRLLFDWFWSSPVLPHGMELWWTGPKAGHDRVPLPTETNRFQRRIRFLGMVSDAELCERYRRARAVVYPSLYEGFGFPVLDALLHATPVLCGRHSSLTEFAGPGVFYFDPCDAGTIDEAFKDLCAAEPLRINRLDLRSACSWESLAGSVLRLCA